MKKPILLFAMLFFTQIVFGQTKAVTENGDSVILYEDGTWDHIPFLDTMFGLVVDDDTDTTEEFNIPLNPEFFKKSADATFLLKSKRLNVGVWLNQNEWTYKKAGGAKEYNISNNRKGLYALLITEKTSIPVELLVEAALINAKKAATDIKIIKQEYRFVNGQQVFMMQMSGIINEIKYHFNGYYYSNKNGSVQLVVTSIESIAKKNNKDIEKFLNGFVEI